MFHALARSSMARTHRLGRASPPATRSRARASVQNASERAERSDARLLAATRAVRLASALCRKTQRMLERSDKTSKSDDSPVTVADFAAQAVVSLALAASAPGVGLVAEESASDMRGAGGATLRRRVTEMVNETLRDEFGRDFSEEEVMEAIDRGQTEGGARGSFWILDPIDGTKGFINGRQYAIALALMEDGEVTGGVLGCPNMPGEKIPRGATEIPTASPGCLFFAYKGRGTRVCALDSSDPMRDGVRITTNKTKDSSEATYMESWGDSIVADHSFTNSLSSAMGVTSPPVRIDSMAKYGALARGDTNMYLRFPPANYREKVWDHAAGAIVVQEAGGVISDGAGKPLNFSEGRFLNIQIGIVATSSPELHATLLETIRKVRP